MIFKVLTSAVEVGAWHKKLERHTVVASGRGCSPQFCISFIAWTACEVVHLVACSLVSLIPSDVLAGPLGRTGGSVGSSTMQH